VVSPRKLLHLKLQDNSGFERKLNETLKASRIKLIYWSISFAMQETF
jgi:hypothetical protein